MTPQAIRHRGLLLLILLGGFALRVAGLDHSSLWLDELIQVYMASKPLPEMLQTMFDHINLPVDIFLSRAMLALGRQDGWLRLAPALAGTLSLPLIYAVARKLAPAPVPVLSMTLLAFSPLAVQYSRELRPYSVLLTLTLLSVLCFLTALRRPRHWPGFIIAILLVLHTHLFAVAVLPVFGLFAVVWALRNRSGPAPRLAPFLPLMMVGLVFIAYMLSPFTPDYIGRIGAALIGGLTQPDAVAIEMQARLAFPGWPEILTRLPYDFTGWFVPGPSAATLRMLGLVLAAVGGLSLRRRPRALGFLALWLLLIPALIIVTLDQRNHWYSPRYIIQALPAGLILIAAGMARLGEIGGRRLGRRWAAGVIAVVAAVYLALVYPVLADGITVQHANVRDAAAYLRQHYQPGDLVVAPVVGRYLGHYLPAHIPVLDSNDPIEVELEGANYERVFILITEYGLLRATQPPWLHPGALLQTFDPAVAVYRGPAGLEAIAFLGQRAGALLRSEQAGGTIPISSLRQLAVAARTLGDWNLAQTFLEAAIGRLPDDAGLWSDLGFARQMQGNCDQAIAAYAEAIRLQPENAWAHLLTANCYRLLGQPQQGLAFAQRAVDLVPGLSAAWSALGNIQHALGQPQRAAQSFAAAIELDDEDINAWYGYARVAAAMALPAAAEAWLRVLSLNPPATVITEACRFLDPADHPACGSGP